jgi:hypothetical protein
MRQEAAAKRLAADVTGPAAAPADAREPVAVAVAVGPDVTPEEADVA